MSPNSMSFRLCEKVVSVSVALIRNQLVECSCSIGGIVVETTICGVGYFQSDPVLVFCSLSRSVGQSV